MDENVLLNRHIIEFASLNIEDLIDWVLKFLPLHENPPLRKWVQTDIVRLLKREEILRERSQTLCYAVKYINYLNSPFKFSYNMLNSFYETEGSSDRKSDSNSMTSYFSYIHKNKSTVSDEKTNSNLLDNQPIVLVNRLSMKTIEKELEENKNDFSVSKTKTNLYLRSQHSKTFSNPGENSSASAKKIQRKLKRSSKKTIKRSLSVSIKKEDQTCSKEFQKISSRQSIEKDAKKIRSNYRNELNVDGFLNSLVEDITRELPCCKKQLLETNNINSPDCQPKPEMINSESTEDILATCVFCKQPASCHPEILDLISNEKIYVHEKCMYFASGLSQSFIPDIDENKSNNKTHLKGFSINDILKEVKRGAKLSCSGCSKKGACSGCVFKNCKKGYHLPCALKHGAICIFDESFPLYCSLHRPKLDISRWYSNFTNLTRSCCICLDEILVSPKDLGCSIIHGQCCSECWMHRDCICNFANSAGLHHIKCPLCNDRDEMFLYGITQMGVWIPDRDASWELEADAFRDLYNSNDPSCSLEKCICSRGRNFYEDNVKKKWYTMRCVHCLIIGAHRSCLQAQFSSTNKIPKRFVCEGCISLENK